MYKQTIYFRSIYTLSDGHIDIVAVYTDEI